MVTVRISALILLPAVAGALLLSGCGDVGTEPGSAGRSATAPPATGSGVPVPIDPSDVPTATGRPIPSGPPNASPTRVTVDGVVEAGVEPGCMVLTAAAGNYQILGGTDVPMGVPVRVTGVLEPGVLTTCQQGTPLRVTDVQRR